jgi:hypothetical protein
VSSSPPSRRRRSILARAWQLPRARRAQTDIELQFRQPLFRQISPDAYDFSCAECREHKIDPPSAFEIARTQIGTDSTEQQITTGYELHVD